MSATSLVLFLRFLLYIYPTVLWSLNERVLCSVSGSSGVINHVDVFLGDSVYDDSKRVGNRRALWKRCNYES